MPVVPVTRQYLRELMQAKVNAAKRLEAAGMVNTADATIDQLVDIGREHAAASREYGQADQAFQNACQRFDEENTQEAVLSGTQPKADAALLDAVFPQRWRSPRGGVMEFDNATDTGWWIEQGKRARPSIVYGIEDIKIEGGWTREPTLPAADFGDALPLDPERFDEACGGFR